MIDIAQMPTPSPAVGAAAPGAASTAAGPTDGKTGGFQSIIGKALSSDEAPAEHGKAPAKDAADPVLSADAKGDVLPADGTNLPLFPFLPVAPAAPVTATVPTLPAAEGNLQDAAVDVATAEGGNVFSLDTRNRLADLMRGAAIAAGQAGNGAAAAAATTTAAAVTVAAATAATVTDDLPAVTAPALTTTRTAMLADEIASKLQSASTPLSYESAAAPVLLNTDTLSAYQNTTSFGTQPLHALGSMLAQPTAAATPPAIGTPVQQPDWGNDLGSRITWMIKQDVTAADIKLNPPHLGPLEVKISMSQDQVSVAFTSHHAVVRDALDTALPRLREMLSDNGLQLANANVSNKSAADQGGSQHYGAGNQGGGQRAVAGNGDGEDGALAVAAALPGAGRYLVDYYA